MSYQQKTIKIILFLISLAVLLVILHFLTRYFSSYYPPIIPYLRYVNLGIDATIAGIGGYYIIRMLKRSILDPILLKRVEKSTARTIELFINILFYSILLLIVLATLGVNLTGAAIGGAVGGIAIGLAAQTVLSNVLSGVMVTGGKTLRPGDPVSLSSWIWGSPIVGETTTVGILFTEVKTTNGNIVKIPNSAFLGNTVFTKLESDNSLIYSFLVSINADVPAEQVLEKASAYIKDNLSKRKASFEAYFSAKAGGTNQFTIILHFMELNSFNTLMD
ncbi:mechanosensitive ion channel family protein, partial [Acidianus sp. RZ1]